MARRNSMPGPEYLRTPSSYSRLSFPVSNNKTSRKPLRKQQQPHSPLSSRRHSNSLPLRLKKHSKMSMAATPPKDGTTKPDPQSSAATTKPKEIPEAWTSVIAGCTKKRSFNSLEISHDNPEQPARKKQMRSALKLRADWDRMPESSQTGLVNHTHYLCYRNSLLQAFLHSPIFVNWILDYVTPDKCVADNREACLSCALHRLTKLYWRQPRPSKDEMRTIQVEIHQILKGYGWATDTANNQGDPDEQALKVFETLKAEIPTSIYTYFESAASLITTSVIACPCGHESRTPDIADHNLSLPLTPRPKGDMLQNYIGQYMDETIDGYKCDGCKKERNVRRYREITNAPELLMVQLKRFNWKGDKIGTPVRFGETLDLTKHVAEGDEQQGKLGYELRSVVKHVGSSGGGHYICAAVGAGKGWRLYNDAEMTRLTSVVDVVGNAPRGFTPYILFYQRIRD